MEAALSFPSGRPTMALGADPMSAFSQPSPGLGQDTPRFISERLSPAAVHLGDNIGTSSSQRSYSTSSNYFNPIHQQQQLQNNLQEDLPWIGTRQQSTTPTYALATSAATPIENITPAAGVESPQDKQHEQHEQHEQHPVEQMSVSLNHQVSLGGPESLGHDSLVQHHPQVHDTQHHQHSWNPSRSLYSVPSDLYSSARDTQSPTTAHSTEIGQQDTNTSTTAHFPKAMSNHHPGGGNGSGDGSSQPPSPHSQFSYSQQQQQQQQQQLHRTHHDLSVSSLHNSLLSSGHVASAQPRQNAHDGGSTTVGASSSHHHSPDMMGFRSQHSPSFPGMGGMPGMPSSLSSKLGPTMSGLPSQSSFQMYPHQPLHQHQHHSDHHQSHAQHSQTHQQHQQHQPPTHHHTLPSPTHQGSPLRLIPPPLPSQSSLSSLGPPLGSPYSSGSGSGAPGSSRGYPSYQHQGVHQPSPHPSGLSGPVISNLHNPSGHLTIVSGMGGINYGGHSSGGSLGDGALGGSRRPLLYSQGQHHGGLHPHLNPGHLGHHHLSGILGGGGGKGGMGMGGPASIHERPFKCDQCPQSFNRNHDLKRHKRIHLAVKPFPCNYCDKSFSRKDALKRHRLVKGCGEKQPNTDNTSSHSSLPPPSSSVLSDTTSDGGSNDIHSLR